MSDVPKQPTTDAPMTAWASALAHLRGLPEVLKAFPWRDTAATLGERFREDRLGLTASSLTFTTTVSLVPLMALALAVFTAFPMFGKLQDGLQRWLVDSLMPDAIARQVLSYVTQFAAKASKLGALGLVILVASGLALMLTIDKTLNQIWRVRTPRPFAQRVLVYWGAITLGPLLLALSIAAATWALAGTKGIGPKTPWLIRSVIDAMQFGLVAAGCAALYHHVPNTAVRWAHAWAGGFFVAIALEVAQRLLGAYLKAVPTYSMIYGAFATVPILLIWIYLMWVVVLLGAVVAAYLPTLKARIQHRGNGPGAAFGRALEVLAALRNPAQPEHAVALAQRLHMDPLQVSSALQTLAELGWANELAAPKPGHWVLLIAPEQTPVKPLVKALLLRHDDLALRLMQNKTVADLL